MCVNHRKLETLRMRKDTVALVTAREKEFAQLLSALHKS